MSENHTVLILLTGRLSKTFLFNILANEYIRVVGLIFKFI